MEEKQDYGGMVQKQDYRIVEINLISAQGLKTTPMIHRRKTTQTYAVVWIDDPSRKLRTGIDSFGAENPTWNDKFLFRLSSDFISSSTSGVNVEIYSVGHLKDSLVGTARCLLSSCLGKFTSVYIHRPSGSFHGILNIASAVCEVNIMGADLDIFRGCSTVNFNDLTRAKSGKEKEKGSGLLGRLRMVKSSPSLSSMTSTPTRSSLRPVKSETSLSTMLSSAESESDDIN